MPHSKSPLFFDTVVLSNFFFADGGLLLLKKRYRKRGKITLQVIEEIEKAMFIDYEPLEQINELLTVFQKITLVEQEQRFYLLQLRNLGAGEASCLAAALHRNGIVATDDKMARNCCKKNNIPVTGTIGILKAACHEKMLDEHTANKMLKQMIDRGFYSPVNLISEVD
jgi:hypothetical protein